MRVVALAAAALHVALCAVAAFLMFFVATFPFENQTPDEAAEDNWLVGAAPVVVILALAVGGATIGRRVALAAAALAAQLVVGAFVVVYAVGESDHSDGKVLLFGAAVAVTAGAAVAATFAERR